ncbi:MAG: prepilin-type N-terminal cleavage/methylation domain-containing protein [Halarcobacter sp.]
MNYKNSFTLLEIIVVIFIGSIFFIYTFIFTKNIYEVNNQNKKTAILKIDLNSTKIILQKNINLTKNKLIYKNNSLYLDDKLLLENVTSFSKKIDSKYIHIDITLEEKIKQKWILKL